MASWTGTVPYASKKQLVSSITGLYDDLQDFQFSTISQVSTLTVGNWLSTPVLYVSDIQGYTAQYSTMIVASDISANYALFSTLLTNNVNMEFKPNVQISFNLKDALFGSLSGLGMIIFETLLGAGAGAGLAFKGIGEGIAAMIMANGSHNTYINTNNFELKGGSTQLQISTLGNAFPAYSSIMRYVSSISPNQVPGAPIFTSTIFYPGTTCIRSVSDPFPCVSQDSNIATSTIQQFGEWVVLPIEELVSTFTGISLSNTTDQPLLEQWRTVQTLNHLPMMDSVQYQTSSNDLNFAYNTIPYPNTANINKLFYHRDEYFLTNNYISSPYIRFQSTITDYNLQYVRSTLSAPLELTYTGNVFDGDFAFCEPDETGFRSTMSVDFIVNGSKDLFIQWGLAVDNLNSTIKAGTAKRVSWDIPGSYSNFIDIPQAISTITNEATQQIIDLKTNPYEIQFNTLGTGMNPSQIAWNVQGMTFGSNTSLSNISNYPYQFNSNLYVNGTIEAQTIIALSSIFATSTFVDTQVSTASIVADVANILELYNKEGYISTLRSSSNNPANDYITTMSRVRMAGFQTPLAIITGSVGNVYDTSRRFDFTTDVSPQAIYLQSQPANNTVMTITSTNIHIANLDVDNLTANNIVYSNADVPNLQTSTIAFGWTGNFNTLPTPGFSLQQSLTTEPGLVWNNYQAASNQVLNIMAFSNTVNMLAQQFSTPLTVLNTTFDATNIQGWASTIFYNASFSPVARVNLGANAGFGELSLQGQSNPIAVSLNTNPGGVGGVPVVVPIGSTYKFTSGGASWTTLSNAPTPGIIQYNNNFKLTMDFENTNISTTDTLCLNAETIKLNGQVLIPNAQFSNIYVNDFVSTSQVDLLRTYTGSLVNEGVINPFNITNTVYSGDFTNVYDTVNPNRGFNAFNSYNVGEWNNNQYNIDTTASSGKPTMILGDLIEKQPPFTPYSGQFWINNGIDSPGCNVPIYVNREGLLSTIGFAVPNQYARIYTNDGTNWSIQSNVPAPQGAGGYTFSNYINTTMTSKLTQIAHGKPLLETTPTRYVQTNKIIFDCPAIRCYTIGSPSFPSKESGFELSSYFDANVVFNEDAPTQSDALNPIVNALNNYYYSVAGWSAQIWISRIRTESLGIQGYDIDPVVGLVSGTPGDYIWFSARYLNVNGPATSISANIRENYFMTPKNYHTSFGWLGQI